MAKIAPLQTNFSAGELDPTLHMRQDTEQYQNGAKSLHNRRCLLGGGTVRRPGTRKLSDLAARSRIKRWIVNRTTGYVVAFSDGRMDAFLRDITTGLLTASGSVTGAPWTGSIWREMVVRQASNTMFLTHNSMAPQVVVRTGAATWSRSAYAFATGPAGRLEQPYLKFADSSRTLTCSDVTGSITLAISGATAWFVALHVGQYIRYHKKASLITAVAVDGLSCTATVVERLPETYSLVVTSSANFAVGEIILGATSGAKGIITAIPDGTHITSILTEGLTPFTAGGEVITGPNGTTGASSAGTTTNGAVSDWDEQMFGPVFGYPSCVEIHRNRLLFAGHTSSPDYLIASALNDFYNHNVGDGSDGDAILESIGDAAASRIVQLYSAENLLLGTDTGLYYVPETASEPFRPTSIAFFPFGDLWPISSQVDPAPFDGGVLFVSGSSVIIARPTGDVGSSWKGEEVSLLAAHLFNSPTDLAVVSNIGMGRERYAMFCNGDGTLAAQQLVSAQKVRNTTPWDTDRDTDTFQSLAGIEDDLYVACIRQIAGNTIYTLELFDPDYTLDAATPLTTLATVTSIYGNTPVNVVTDSGLHLGTYPLTLDDTPAGPYVVGLNYTTELETLPPVIEDSEGSHAGDYMRIIECYVHVRSSARFAVNGRELAAYQSADDISEPPPLKDGPQRFEFLGWEREPTITITQTDPLALEVQAIRLMVAY